MRHQTIDVSQDELFRSRLQNQIDLRHELVKLRKLIEWEEIETEFNDYESKEVGRKGLPVQLMVGLLLLQYMNKLSDVEVVERWKENPYWQYFCGYDYFQLELPADASSLSRWRKRLGSEKLDKILSATVKASVNSGAVKASALQSVSVDTTVMEKNIEFPTDTKLIAKGIGKLVSTAKKAGVKLKQTYKLVVKRLVVQIHGYAHAKQFKRLRAAVRRLKTIGGRILRDCERKVSFSAEQQKKFAEIFRQMEHLLTRKKQDKNKLYSLHEEEAVSCISKGKAHKKYEFGCKVALSIANRGTGIITSAKSFHNNPYDGHTLSASLEHSEAITGVAVSEAFVDKGYKGHGVMLAKVFISGQRRGVTKIIHRKLKRRQAIEAHIGHLKNDGKLDLCRLRGIAGDRIHVALCAAAYNLKLILSYLKYLLRQILNWFLQMEIGAQGRLAMSAA